MVLGETELEHEFAKIYRKGVKKTLAFFREVLTKCPSITKTEFEDMIRKENIRSMETTDAYKSVQDEYHKVYSEGSVKTLKFIAKNMETLPEYALSEIFNIIKRNRESYTSKKLETLVNLGTLKEETIQEIVKFILFIKGSMMHLDTMMQQMSNMKDNLTNKDALEAPSIPEDPNYNPILPDYNQGPAPVLKKHHV